MIRIIGNSPERVRLIDLSDVIYYRQVKEYSDQEFEASRDLQKAISNGRLAILGKSAEIRGSIPDGQVAVPVQGINLQDVRRIMKEESARDAVREAIPVIVDVIRQEMGSLLRQMPQQSQPMGDPATFVDPSFAPNVSTEGMTSNIKLETREIKSGDLSSSLDALRKLQNPNSSST